ncbi:MULTISPECIES: hypothetical protein [Bacillus cereus group]|uniref:hypothetical protein n=1 Tax=Bacillus cereus group TaxID=86661 RepID=UPI0021D36347|nr:MULTISPECIES: hypothetical protein [Bacillus cereus group]MCU5201641.1 hypothetical protein [Bacillus paranthracis]MCU5374721.1 hypothetical protein [Bacillus pacificus]
MWYSNMKKKLQLITDTLINGSEDLVYNGKDYEERTQNKTVFSGIRDRLNSVVEIIKTKNSNIDYDSFGFDYIEPRYDFKEPLDYYSSRSLKDENSQKTLHDELKQTKKEENIIDFMTEFEKRRQDIKDQIQNHQENLSKYEKTSNRREELSNKIDHLKEQLQTIDKMHKPFVKDFSDQTYHGNLVGSSKDRKTEMKHATNAQREMKEKGNAAIDTARSLKEGVNRINMALKESAAFSPELREELRRDTQQQIKEGNTMKEMYF